MGAKKGMILRKLHKAHMRDQRFPKYTLMKISHLIEGKTPPNVNLAQFCSQIFIPKQDFIWKLPLSRIEFEVRKWKTTLENRYFITTNQD